MGPGIRLFELEIIQSVRAREGVRMVMSSRKVRRLG
jgi:hypothetical protein